MNNKTSKMGYSENGGIYIGKNIQTNIHLHQAITIVFSFGKPLSILCKAQTSFCYGAIVQSNSNRKFTSDPHDLLAFIHIAPFSEFGLKLKDNQKIIKELDMACVNNSVEILQEWFRQEENNETITLSVIHKIVSEFEHYMAIKPIDERIEKSLKCIQKSDFISLEQVSNSASLSSYRFSHLFKKETGISFRQFVLHTKLIRSLKAISLNHSLNEAAFLGGFSDQAHFTRTYLKAFGVLPSKTVK